MRSQVRRTHHTRHTANILWHRTRTWTRTIIESGKKTIFPVGVCSCVGWEQKFSFEVFQFSVHSHIDTCVLTIGMLGSYRFQLKLSRLKAMRIIQLESWCDQRRADGIMVSELDRWRQFIHVRTPTFVFPSWVSQKQRIISLLKPLIIICR